ncbi:hypothetical protein BDZ91DRAFT_797376 [Kalaharituber pfeilii]|nr:hypothetical protein BDZ91DRAFT_797376 [Kalaharituber pfeilii]
MNNWTHVWTGAEPDINGIYPSQYLLGQRFVVPFPGGGKNAIAVARSQEIYIISLYTILVTAIFAAWWIIITLAVRYLVPEKLAHQPSITILRSWTIYEPVQASIAMMKHCRETITAYCSHSIARKKTLARQNVIDLRDVKFPWINITITACVLLLAVAVIAGSTIAGIVLPNHFVLGNAAPANPYTLFTYNWGIEGPIQIAPEALGITPFIGNLPGRHAIAVVDNARSYQLISNGVKFEAPHKRPPSDRPNETSYTIQYSISVSGHEMGLQHASDLKVIVDGNCTFMYEWKTQYPEDEPGAQKNGNMTLWPNDDVYQEDRVEIIYSPGWIPSLIYKPAKLREGIEPKQDPTYQFALIPQMWGIGSNSPGIDPWYFTTNGSRIYTIDSRRPALRCWEKQTWSYNGWEWMWKSNNVEANKSSAATDVKRLVEGAYIMIRELFRDTAIEYSILQGSDRQFSNNHSYNLLRAVDGEPLPGAGDFVVRTEHATALRLEDPVAIPAVLLASWLVVFIFLWLQPAQANSARRIVQMRKILGLDTPEIPSAEYVRG